MRKMIKVRWDIEEAVALCDVYIKTGRSLSVDRSILEKLSVMMNKRARMKGVTVDEKFRNTTGLSMQIGCIHYVATGGKEGLSNASKVFYEAYNLFEENLKEFNSIVNGFYEKYS